MTTKALKIKPFNNTAVYCRGWYWALPSKDLGRGKSLTIRFLGKEILLFRGESGKVFAMDPYCPHMGAHLKLGRIEGDSIRCAFHGWKYSGMGACEGAPACNKFQPKELPADLKTYSAAEKYSMIWIHTHEGNDPLPHFPALEEKSSRTDEIETRYCHPTLILGGGVDEDHFNFVHEKTVRTTGRLSFEASRISPQVISYSNTASMPRQSFTQKLLAWAYGGILKYKVTYWYGTTAFAELGTPWFPLYSIFAYRPTPEGNTEGLNIYVSPYSGMLGRMAIFLTRKILRKGGGEDTPIQNTLRFRETKWVRESLSFAGFIDYVNEQECLPFEAQQP